MLERSLGARPFTMFVYSVWLVHRDTLFSPQEAAGPAQGDRGEAWGCMAGLEVVRSTSREQELGGSTAKSPHNPDGQYQTGHGCSSLQWEAPTEPSCPLSSPLSPHVYCQFVSLSSSPPAHPYFHSLSRLLPLHPPSDLKGR